MIKVITDSVSDFSLDEAIELGIDVVPLKVSFKDETFIDLVTITREEFYEKLISCTELPITGMPSPQQFLEVYNKYPDDEIIGIFVSAINSGTMQSAIAAKEETKRNNIYIIDSENMSGGLNILVRMACKYRDEGKSTTEIVSMIEDIKKQLELITVIDTMKYLVKGGRLSPTSAIIANVLSVKPIIHVKHGVIESAGKARGMKAGIKSIVDSANKTRDRNLPIIAIHAFANDLFIDLLNELKENPYTCTVGTVVGTHVGPGAVGLAYFSKKE